MYIPTKSKEILNRSKCWVVCFKDAEQFIEWSKNVIKHIKKRQFTEIYGNYFIYCNSYIKNVSEVLKRMNLTLTAFFELLESVKVINKRELQTLKQY